MADKALILADPEWLAHRYDEASDSFRFVRATREAHRAATFLTDEHLADTHEFVAVPRIEIDRSALPSAPIHFVFHSAYCCSTLVARMFDRQGSVMGLKEPVLLNDMVGWRRRRADTQRLATVLDLSLALLARPFAGERHVVVKRSSIVTSIASAMMGIRPQARALQLYAPIEDFLSSIAVKGLWGRQWVRTSLIGQAKDNALSHRFTTEELLELTDLQAAGLGWLSHLAIFAKMREKFGAERIAICDSASLLRDPLCTTRAFYGHFDIELSDAHAMEVAQGEAFTRNSKDQSHYSAEHRRAQLDQTREANREEIEMVAEWVRRLSSDIGVDSRPQPTLALG